MRQLYDEIVCHLDNQKLKRQRDTFLAHTSDMTLDMAGDDFQERDEETEKG